VPPESGNLVRVRCHDATHPEGVPIGLVERNARVLSRPYLRAFPGNATFASDPAARTLRAAGAATTGDVEAWVPGDARPRVRARNLGRVKLTRVPGGWILRAAVLGAWELTAEGA
jgi:hypothetical protein